MSSARQNATRHNNINASLPPTEVGKQAGVASQTRFVTYAEWLWENRHALETAQLTDGYDWLCEAMVNAPDEPTFKHLIGAGWRDHRGRRGGKEAFSASWAETKGGAPLLRITVNDFRRDPQSWHGGDTIKRLRDDAKGERNRTTGQQRDARQGRQTREYNAMRDAEERSRAAAYEAAQRRKALSDALARYEAAPPATETGVYLKDKGFAGVDIPGLKRGEHPERGGYDVLPVRDVETGELTSLAYFWDVPFTNDDGERVRKTFQWGGRITGCAIFLSPVPPKKWAGEIATGEGVATVLSVRESNARPDMCYVAALAVDNLEPVVAKLARRFKKATHTLILDNDWQKALEIDHKGRPKRNAGLEIGSELAMKRNLRFYMPDFTGYGGADGSLSDFNDLERVAGRAEVARQLVLQYPDPDVVFKGAREAETARLRSVFSNHDVTVVNQPYIPADAILEGRVNILVGPPGSGKTTLTSAHQAAHPDARRLMINPLAALATTNAERFGMGNYQALLSDAELRSAQQLSICQDSLPRLAVDGNPVPHYDVVHLEEPETLLGRQTGDIKDKPLVRDVMRYVVSQAGTVIVTDADADVTTLRQLERWRPDERFNIVINEQPLDIEVDVYEDREDVQAEALELLEAGAKVAYPCSTAIAAREVHGLIQKRLELPGLCVTADNDNDAEVREFFRRPNETAPKYSYVAYSPKIDTGLSVDIGHGYSRVFAEVVTGHDSPRRAMQRLHRFRGVRRWSVYIDPAIVTYPTDRDEIARRWGEGVTKYDSHLLGIVVGGRRGIRDADYEAMVLDAAEAENIAKTNLRFNLLRRLYARGAKIRFVPPRGAQTTAEGMTLIDERKDLERADYTHQRLEAKPITDAQAAAIDRAQRRTGEQSAQLDAWRIRRAFGMRGDTALEDSHISEYRRGQLATEVHRLELAGADQERLRGWSERQHELSEQYRADERYYGIEAHVYRSALRAYNVDPETLTLTSEEPVGAHSEGVQRAIADFVEHRDDLVAAGFKLPPSEAMKADPMRVIGNIVRRMGGSTRTGDKVQRSRVIDADWLSTRRDIILERQKRREERAEAAAVNSGQAAVNLQQAVAAVKVITKEKDLNDVHCRETTAPVTILPTAADVPLKDDRQAFLEATLMYIAQLPERPTPELVYETAVPELAMTFREAVQDEQYDKYRTKLLDGTPLKDATPTDLRRHALAYFGWARDRQRNGVRNIGAFGWLELADEVIAGYRKRA